MLIGGGWQGGDTAPVRRQPTPDGSLDRAAMVVALVRADHAEAGRLRSGEMAGFAHPERPRQAPESAGANDDAAPRSTPYARTSVRVRCRWSRIWSITACGEQRKDPHCAAAGRTRERVHVMDPPPQFGAPALRYTLREQLSLRRCDCDVVATFG